MTIIVQISDMHVSCPGDRAEAQLQQAERLRAAVRWINALTPMPDAVLATGDLVDNGRPDQYQRLVEALQELAPPVWLMVGNHDHRAHLRAAFPDHDWMGREGFVHYVRDCGALRVIALDSMIEGRSEGRLCAARLDWLEVQLAAEPARPTLVALHHPPVATGLVQMDAMGLGEGREALAAIISRHDQVVRVVAGHIHRPVTTLFGGKPFMTCPSTSHQIALEIDREDGIGIVTEPPACLLHVWREGQGMVSHQAPIGDFERIVDVDLRAHH